jgi:hypothetical protein
MKTANRKRGRPRNMDEKTEFWRFVRSGMVMGLYDEFRRSGEKHSGAVTEIVNYFRKYYPEVPLSEVEVRRVLAKWRPKGSQKIFCFDRVVPTKEELQKQRLFSVRVAMLQGQKVSDGWVKPRNSDPQRPLRVYRIGLGERPKYSLKDTGAPKA